LRDTNPSVAIFATILANFRSEYASNTKLDPKLIISSAETALREIASSICLEGKAEEFKGLFEELPKETQEGVRRKVASTGASGIQSVIENGEFLSFADSQEVRRFVQQHPEFFFDGRFWTQPYLNLDYGSEKVNLEARQRVLERYDSYLSDAVWLASQSPRDLDRCSRDELIRATLSVALLESDGTF
jgi:hypothetical protein